ncbi:pre-mRNA-processing-splicing factor 8 [Sphaceloma murrayae]|uniref:Pre-mRNA-processing-splicing factor 8 n=1 Tax=Sphaceloma murrayae TaxID=2082308 RepID=A0A2K1R0D9_9PEZI|nr:pre-mRNA-processing-splicing factor 8 [Sphaceloma murrayae]
MGTRRVGRHTRTAAVYPVVLLISLLSAVVQAQQLLVFGPNALPTCAQGCQYLSQAQAACVPPAAPATTQQTYLACFCQSAYLVNLRNDATQVCGNVCQGSDLPLISQWYTNTCNAGADTSAPQPTTTAVETAVVSTTSATTAAPSSTTTTTTTTSTAASQSGAAASSSGQPRSWWSGHWRWVLMIILIVILLSSLTVLGVWLRRRHRRKRDLMGGRFNDGITTRAMTHTQPATNKTTTSTGLVAFPYPGSAMGKAGQNGGTNPTLGSSADLARARETDREAVRLASAVASSGEDVQKNRATTKANGAEFE